MQKIVKQKPAQAKEVKPVELVYPLAECVSKITLLKDYKGDILSQMHGSAAKVIQRIK